MSENRAARRAKARGKQAARPNVRAQDVDAPEQVLTLNGERYRLRYDNRSARVAEQVIFDETGEIVGFLDIVDRMLKGQYTATMAIFYGAVCSHQRAAGEPIMDWDEFDDHFDYSCIPGVQEHVMAAVADYLPEPEGDAPQEDDGGPLAGCPGT